MNSVPRPIRKETRQLLDWYDKNARELPWRSPPGSGEFADPYHVWLSEIMLQQTQVVSVKSYYLKFLQEWPNVQALAKAEQADILKAWAGLGYYSRARNLKKCADVIVAEHDGRFPARAAQLKALPGIGDYTSAAIAAIAFGECVAVVDGNVERVMARVHVIEEPVPKAKRRIRQLTQALVSDKRPGDFAQAMMDLGATLCTPKKPKCKLCPWENCCQARTLGTQENYPTKIPRKKLPERKGAAFVALNKQGKILLRHRPDTGMLAQMSEVPSSNWSARENGETSVNAAPFEADWQHVGNVHHGFTHFKLAMKVYFCRVDALVNVTGWWVDQNEIMQEALPELMKKVITLALGKEQT